MSKFDLNVNEAGIPDDAEFTTEDLELIAVMYIKGDMFTYDDMTDEQKYDLGFKIAQDLSIDEDGYLCRVLTRHQ